MILRLKIWASVAFDAGALVVGEHEDEDSQEADKMAFLPGRRLLAERGADGCWFSTDQRYGQSGRAEQGREF
jgi:hypothetical protein